ncbi:hypothetical protein Ciccas_007056 [Cichlidogyrus casuarinus]|uniref:RRM domain-containing protein n=1 Tax=Cichlidogyrus casuarinus TaxID=1844966 RepID=A0ABD2Q3Z8_9PLAT
MLPESKEDQNKKLFIGGLSQDTDENALKEFYSQWGEITDVVVMKEPRTGKSRGFGFVTFADEASVDAAQSKRPHEINNKKVDSKRAMPREDSSPEIHATVNKIFVRSLKPEITDQDLREYFSYFGEIADATVVKNKENNTSRGFGFVTFADTDSVDKIILKCPHEINGNKIEVKKAVDRNELAKMKPRQARFGGPMGGFPQGAWGPGGYPPQAYSHPYGAPAYGNYAPAGVGYYYDQSMGGGDWNAQGQAQGNDFGSYQQGFSGGPVRGGANNQQGANYQQRSAPYQQR